MSVLVKLRTTADAAVHLKNKNVLFVFGIGNFLLYSYF